MRILPRTLAASVVVGLAASHGLAASLWPTAGWPRSSPEEQGLDSGTLAAGDQYIRSQCPTRYSFLVVRNGRLVYEKYYRGVTKDSATHVMSIAKSVLSILIGQALEEGALDTMDHKFLDYYPEYVTGNLPPMKRDITLRHLLTMTAGFQWSETDLGGAWVASKDWLKFIIDLPMAARPGEVFNYNTGLSHLLAGILAKSTGTTALDFGRRHLFDPLSIWNFRWETDSHGYYIGGFHMYFTSADLARFGYLYLKKGVWEDRQIVSRNWVEASTRLQVHNFSSIDIGDYGYHWWVRSQWGYPVFLASGFGGQYIFVVPALDLVMVSTADPAKDTRDLHLEAFNLLNQYVIPAIQAPKQPKPSIDSGGIADIVPGSWVSIRGKNLAAGTRQWQPDDMVAGNLPVHLDGLSVTIDGRPAYVGFVSPERIDVLAPDDDAVGTVAVQVTSAPGLSAQTQASLVAASPSLFTWGERYALAQHPDGSLVGPAGLLPGASPARPTETIVLWGTGFGRTEPPSPSGEVIRHSAPLAEMPQVTVGEMPAEVLSAGITEGSAGVYRIEVKIPAAAGDGDLPTVAGCGGVKSNSSLRIPVRR